MCTNVAVLIVLGQTPSPPPGLIVPMYRVVAEQWTNDIGNSNLADAAGDACFQNKWHDRHPDDVVARYKVAVNTDFGKYSLCNKGTCEGGDRYRVGCESYQHCSDKPGIPCSSETRSNLWFSLPQTGECRESEDPMEPGPCMWKVLQIEKYVRWSCILANGCTFPPKPSPPPFLEGVDADSMQPDAGSCDGHAFEAAYNKCPDLCASDYDWHAQYNKEDCEQCVANTDPGADAGPWWCDSGTSHGWFCTQTTLGCSYNPIRVPSQCSCHYTGTPPSANGMNVTRLLQSDATR